MLCLHLPDSTVVRRKARTPEPCTSSPQHSIMSIGDPKCTLLSIDIDNTASRYMVSKSVSYLPVT